MSSKPDISDLLTQHYKNSAPEVSTPSIPDFLTHIISSILILRNPQYPNHFTNATHIIISRKLNDLSEGDEAALAGYLRRGEVSGFQNAQSQSMKYRFIDLPRPFRNSNKIFSFVQEQCYYCMKYSRTNPSEGSQVPPLTVHLDDDDKPRYHHIEIINGADYFRHRFPAKSTLADRENTLAITLKWSDSEDENPVPAGYIQYITSESSDSSDESLALITGLEIQSSFRGKGLARKLLYELRARLPTTIQLWLQVSTDNFSAVGLYLRSGFNIEYMAYSADGRLLDSKEDLSLSNID